MLPRELVTRSWRPLTGSLVMPGMQRLVASAASRVGAVTGSTASAASSADFCRTRLCLAGANEVDLNKFTLALGETVMLRAAHRAAPPQQQPAEPEHRPFVPAPNMPTKFLEQRHLEDTSAGGSPQQRGSNKTNKWQRRSPWLSGQVGLDLARMKVGPPTPSFPAGVPVQRIRGMRHLAGYCGRVNTGGRKHKMYFSLKRGR